MKSRQMIVKFTSFRARSIIYLNRVKGNGERVDGCVPFYIDQTKRRFQLKKMAMDYVKTKLNVDFLFVDINCNLCIRFKNGQYKFFNSEEEMINVVG